jgi:hypothetical protein
MLTMQEFYNKLSSEDRQKDSYWRSLAQLVNTSLDLLKLLPGDLTWYFWSTPSVTQSSG